MWAHGDGSRENEVQVAHQADTEASHSGSPESVNSLTKCIIETVFPKSHHKLHDESASLAKHSTNLD